MDVATARRLADLTKAFYVQVSDSFSASRSTPWPGWRLMLDGMGLSPQPELHVLDLACGNLRFERFLAGELARKAETARVPDGSLPLARAYAFDCCDALAQGELPPEIRVTYTHLDVAEALLAGGGLVSCLGAPACDLSVCFGFMHHLALPAHRRQVLEALVAATRPGGFVAVSFWQLSRSERLLAKAREVTRVAVAGQGFDGLESGDYLLGWQGRTDVLRYCHDFSEEEIDDLAASVASRAREVARFSADGRSDQLNRYLVLQVR